MPKNASKVIQEIADAVHKAVPNPGLTGTPYQHGTT
jgi:hypothetical protein